jgi:uncharacterized protein (TIGR00369 family)
MSLDPDDPVVALMRNLQRPPLSDFFAEELLTIDAAAGTARASFVAGPNICTQEGNVHGGFLAAMLDQVLLDAAYASADLSSQVMTLEINCHYLQPAAHGRVLAEAEVTRRGRSTAFVEGRLTDAGGTVLVTATGVAAIRESTG